MSIPTNKIDQVLARVKINLGRGTGNTTINEYGIEWYNRAQKSICKKANLWFMHTSTELSFTQGDDEEDLPSDFKDEDSVWIKDSNGKFTELDPMDDMDYRRYFSDDTASNAQSQPSHYILQPTSLKVRPIPDGSYTIVLVYWKFLSDLIAESSNTNVLLDSYDELMEAETTYWGFRSLQQFESANYWKGISEKEMKNLLADNAERILPDELVLHARPDVKGNTIEGFKGRE